MEKPATPKHIYIDTSALRGMKFNVDVAKLLALSDAGVIRIHISETTLWERGRQQYERDYVSDRVVPYPDGINRYLAWLKVHFEKHGVIVIPSDDIVIEKAKEHIQDDNTYFSQDNENDQRDAHVLATAEVKLEKNTLILCSDNNLAQAFEKIAGFTNIRRDFKNYLLELAGEEFKIPALEKPSLDALDEYQIATTFSKSFHGFIDSADSRFHEYLVSLPSISDKLNAKLENMKVLDAEIRKRILGYTQWFSPIGKDQLVQFLGARHYEKEQVENNAQRLKQENLLLETENHWFTNTQDDEAKEICEQAMSVVMPEILELLELN